MAVSFLFFNDAAASELYTLSLHDALPIYAQLLLLRSVKQHTFHFYKLRDPWAVSCRLIQSGRSEEHTSELQSRRDLVCRLLLEKKKTIYKTESPPLGSSVNTATHLLASC